MLLGQSFMCNESVSQEIEESRKMAKCSLKEFEHLQVWSFLKTTMHFFFLRYPLIPIELRETGYVTKLL